MPSPPQRRAAACAVDPSSGLSSPCSPPRPELEALLQDLGSQVSRGAEGALALAPSRGRLATGLTEIDRLLGGGFPQGRLSEVAGPASCGRTSLALALLARTTARGELAGVIDGPDAFDPISAQAAGVELSRVLWVRPGDVGEALRSAEHILATGGFALTLIDLTLADPPRVAAAAWSRLRRSAAGSEAALVVLGRQRLAGSSADLAMEMGAARPHFAAAPDWLEGLEGRVELVRNRSGPGERAAAVRFHTALPRAA
jgi:hypothetical protein